MDAIQLRHKITRRLFKDTMVNISFYLIIPIDLIPSLGYFILKIALKYFILALNRYV